MSESEDGGDCTPPDILKAASNMTMNLLPTKSRSNYNKSYHEFMEWKMNNNAISFSENVLLAYFQELSEKYKVLTSNGEMPIRPLSAELAEKARIELNEDPKRVEDSLAHLKDWISKQPHLRVRTDDQWLVSFLRGCKYSLERSKEKIDLYYSLRTIAPDLFVLNHRHPKYKEIRELGLTLPLPKTASPTSPRVMLIRAGRYDPNKYSPLEIASAFHPEQVIGQYEDDHASICGVDVILDMEGVSMAHMTQMTPSMVKKIIASGQDAAPIRMKGAHYLNTPTGFETILNLFKSFMNEKNQKRLYVHNKDYEALYKYVPKEILPEEYGGSGGTIQSILDHWTQKLEEYRSFLDEDLTHGTDESKRPGKPRTAEEMFGLEGSFRQLEFD